MIPALNLGLTFMVVALFFVGIFAVPTFEAIEPSLNTKGFQQNVLPTERRFELETVKYIPAHDANTEQLLRDVNGWIVANSQTRKIVDVVLHYDSYKYTVLGARAAISGASILHTPSE